MKKTRLFSGIHQYFAIDRYILKLSEKVSVGVD